ncbi:MAG: YdcH family protein [Erythrobacter sp.]|nr:YdcH family protein [Erythrobacter sp.]
MASSPASGAASSHLNALQSKHAGLDARLRDELARPAPDAAMIQSLKKQKLRLKEEIARS